MEESIFQDEPFFNGLLSKIIRDAVSEKVGRILDALGHVAVGLIPGVGEAVGVYELISGRDIFTGEKLSDLERAAIAFGLLIGVGSEFKAFGSAFDVELARMSATEAREASASLKYATRVAESKSWSEYLQTRNYEIYEYEGTTKVAGVEQDVSRRIYQRTDIDPTRIEPKSGKTNLELMKKGRAPYLNDGSQVNLHHTIQMEPGPLVEMSAAQHDEYTAVLHGIIDDGESFRNVKVLDSQFNNFRQNYWKEQARLFEKGLR